MSKEQQLVDLVRSNDAQAVADFVQAHYKKRTRWDMGQTVDTIDCTQAACAAGKLGHMECLYALAGAIDDWTQVIEAAAAENQRGVVRWLATQNADNDFAHAFATMVKQDNAGAAQLLFEYVPKKHQHQGVLDAAFKAPDVLRILIEQTDMDQVRTVLVNKLNGDRSRATTSDKERVLNEFDAAVEEALRFRQAKMLMSKIVEQRGNNEPIPSPQPKI